MNRYRILLALIILLSVITQLVWLRIDRRPPAYDEAAYLERSLEIFNAIEKGPVKFIKSLLGLGEYRGSYRPYRVLLPLTTLPFYLLFGKSADIGVMANVVYIVVILISVYGIGKRLFSERVGLFSAFIFSMFPLFSSMSRVFMPELAATALVTLSIYLLIHSNYFQDRRFALLFGLTLGLGMLSMEIYFVGILGPLLYIVWKGKLTKEKTYSRNLLISVLVGVIITSLFYLPNINLVKESILVVAFAKRIAIMYELPQEFGLRFLTFHIMTTISYGISFFYSLAFCAALFLFYKLKDLREERGLFLSWIIISYLILTLAWAKNPIYILIAFPPLALIIAGGLINIPSKKVRTSTLSLIVIVGLLQSFAYSFDLGWPLERVNWYPIKSKDIPRPLFRKTDYDHPSAKDWKTEEILESINNDKKSSFPDKKECVIKIIPNHYGISWSIFSYYIHLNELPLKVMKGDPQFMKFIGYENILKGCDYVVTKTGEQGEGDWDRDFMMEYAQKVMEQIEKSSFKKLDKEFLLPDGSLVHIYRR